MSAETYGTAVEMLAMPKTYTLTSEQIDGTVCVWCTKPLDDTGLRLGPRIRVTGTGIQRWLPRACHTCTSREAARVYQIHIRTCARCSHGERCRDSRALHKLAQEHR